MRVPAYIGLIFAASPAIADEGFPRLDVHGLLDLRAVQTDDQIGWLDHGQDYQRRLRRPLTPPCHDHIS